MAYIGTFDDYCKNLICEHIRDYRGREVYANELGMILTDSESSEPECECTGDEAVGYLKAWRSRLDDFAVYFTENYGENISPDMEPRRFMAYMVMTGVVLLMDEVIEELGIVGEDIVLDEVMMARVDEALEGKEVIL